MIETSSLFYHFFWLDGFAVPTPAQVTPAVGRLQQITCYKNNYAKT